MYASKTSAECDRTYSPDAYIPSQMFCSSSIAKSSHRNSKNVRNFEKPHNLTTLITISGEAGWTRGPN